MSTLQVPNVGETFPAVSHPHLDRETCPWEIDSARTSALAQIKSDFRSKSTSCLVREGDNADEKDSPVLNLKIIVKKVRRKSHEVEETEKTEKKKSKKTLGLHRRCHSAVILLSRQDAFDSNDEERNRSAAFAALKYIENNNNVYSSAESALEQDQKQQQQSEERPTDKTNTFPRQSMLQFVPQPSPKSSKPEKSNTFPRQMTLHTSSPAASSQANMGKKFMKSVSLMSSPVKHFSHFLSPPTRLNNSSVRYISYVALTATTTPVLQLRSVLILSLKFFRLAICAVFSSCSISFFSFSPKLNLQSNSFKNFIFVHMVSGYFLFVPAFLFCESCVLCLETCH